MKLIGPGLSSFPANGVRGADNLYRSYQGPEVSTISTGFVNTYIFLFSAWVIWCALHSLLISVQVTDMLRVKAGRFYPYYRLTYNIFSLLSLAMPLYVSLQIRQFEEPVFSWDGWLAPVRLFMLLTALLLFWGGGRYYNLSFFLGIYQIRTGISSILLKDQEQFNTDGISGIVRHPWYTAGILLCWSGMHTVYPSTILISATLTCYFIVGAFLEERKLVRCYGERYVHYQQTVSMLLPFKWLRLKLGKR